MMKRNRIGSRLAEEWLKSRTLFTAMFFSLFCYMALQDRKITPELNTIVSTLLGYWFGRATKGEQK